MFRRKRIGKLLSSLGAQSDVELRGLSSTEFELAFLRERALADRSLRSFCVVVFLSRGEPDEDLAQLVGILEQRLRTSDLVGQISTGLVAALLPETDESGANSVASSILGYLAERNLKFDYKVYVYPKTSRRAQSGDDVNRTNGNGGSGPSRGDRSTIHSGLPRREAVGEPLAGAQSLASPLGIEELLAPAQATALWAKATSVTGPARSQQLAPVLLPSEPPNDLAQLRSELGVADALDLEPLFCEPLSWRRRALDVVVSGSLLAVLSPLCAIVALLVKLTSPGPVLFVQARAGQGGTPFAFYKFRSMYVDADKRKSELQGQNEKDGPIFKIKNDPRMTPVGRWLRRSSLDELPQLYNVLIGDMTLVGPRPPTLDEVEHYLPWQRRRLCLKGGLTCIWQVSGRSEVGFEDWVRMDIRYTQKRGLGMDLGLLARTAGAVASGRGAY